MTERKPDDLEADLSAYLDGELDEARRQQVQRRLAESADARTMLEELRAISDGLAALPRRKAPDELAARMAHHAERRLLFDDPARRRPRILRLAVRISAAAAVLAACVFVGYRVLERPRTQPVERVAGSDHPKSALPMVAALPRSGPLAGGRGLPPDAAALAAPGDSVEFNQLESLSLAPAESDRATVIADPEAPAGVLPAVPEEPAEVVVAHARDVALDDDDASVGIVIRARSESEFVAAAAVVGLWSPSAGEAAPAREGPVELTCAIAPGDLESRIAQLMDVTSRQHVSFETRFGAADAEIVDIVARALRVREAEPETPRRDESPAYLMSRVAPDSPLAGAGQPEAISPAPATVTPMPSPAPAERVTAAAPAEPEEKRGGRGGRRAGSAPQAGFDDRRNEETVRRDIRAQHEAATAEPDPPTLHFMFGGGEGKPADSAPAAGSRPPDLAGAPGEPIVDSAPEQPAAPPADAITLDRPGPLSLFDYLLSLAFPPMAGWAVTDAGWPRPPEHGTSVRLRVTVLPPPPETAPASQPASAPARPGTPGR